MNKIFNIIILLLTIITIAILFYNSFRIGNDTQVVNVNYGVIDSINNIIDEALILSRLKCLFTGIK